jgi:2-polyprenyl-3-methyl-5-hydroxy-6-metoxy-1,4-benzoquinol methylase
MNPKTRFDENIVCPDTGKPFFIEGDRLITVDGSRDYEIRNGIPLLAVAPADEPRANLGSTSKKVEDFYTDAPFPNYNDFDSMDVFLKRADKGIYANLLRQQIPMNASILEVGCGTGQLSNFLAATTMSRVYATDMTLASLQLGTDFAQRNNVHGLTFLNMNLFAPCIGKASMDIVISNGVLHHTADPKKAFMAIAPLVKPGGFVIVGLYDKIGRLRTDLRRLLVRVLGEWVLFLDPHLRKTLSVEKRRAWIQDQYFHPQESKHSMSEVLGWFEEAGFSFVSSIPKIHGAFSANEQLFEPKSPGGKLDRYNAEIEMLFTQLGGEGGLFIMIGQKTG